MGLLAKNVPAFTMTSAATKKVALRGVHPRDIARFTSGSGIVGSLLATDGVNLDWHVGDEVVVWNSSAPDSAETRFIKAVTLVPATGINTYQLASTSATGVEAALTGTYTTSSYVAKVYKNRIADKFYIRFSSASLDAGKLYIKTSPNDSGITAANTDFVLMASEVFTEMDCKWSYMSLLTDDAGTITVYIRVLGQEEYFSIKVS